LAAVHGRKPCSHVMLRHNNACPVQQLEPACPLMLTASPLRGLQRPTRVHTCMALASYHATSWQHTTCQVDQQLSNGSCCVKQCLQQLLQLILRRSCSSSTCAHLKPASARALASSTRHCMP
jgi:hypothetical protein